jgi:hypothetical protein
MHNSQTEVKSNTLIDFNFPVCIHKDRKALGGGPEKNILGPLDFVLM